MTTNLTMIAQNRTFNMNKHTHPYRGEGNPNPHHDLRHQPYPKSVPSLLRARARKFDPNVAHLLDLDADTVLIFDASSIDPSLVDRDADVLAMIETLGKTGPPPPPPPPPPDAVIPKAP
ncbi:hypothetical protein ONZ45_g18768 [Pleurotus djamor]|nr:hypothetical protein ONZ45_g18768 [Pleurotus djamor]